MEILIATGQIEENNPLLDYMIMRLLSSDGNLQSIRGALLIASKAKEKGCKYKLLEAISDSDVSHVTNQSTKNLINRLGG